MVKFNFKSQIATTREQSERLLALGLKAETADIHHYRYSEGYWDIQACPPRGDSSSFIPAWSLGRLIEMLPSAIPISEDLPTYNHNAYLNLTKESVDYSWEDYIGEDRMLIGFYGNGFFAGVVDTIELLIKKGYFNKEYLEK